MSETAYQLEDLIRRIVREGIAAQAIPGPTKEAYSEKVFCKLVGISQETLTAGFRPAVFLSPRLWPYAGCRLYVVWRDVGDGAG